MGNTAISRESIEPDESNEDSLHRQKFRVTVDVYAVVEEYEGDINVHFATLDHEQLSYRQCLYIQDECAEEIWDQLPKEG